MPNLSVTLNVKACFQPINLLIYERKGISQKKMGDLQKNLGIYRKIGEFTENYRKKGNLTEKNFEIPKKFEKIFLKL